jgi:hypothetical protein
VTSGVTSGSGRADSRQRQEAQLQNGVDVSDAVSGAERQTSGAERQTSGAERQTSGAERQTSGAERQTQRMAQVTIHLVVLTCIHVY